MKPPFVLAWVFTGGLMITSCQNPDPMGLPESQLGQIEGEVRQAAIRHLNAKDATTAKNNYTEDVIAASNEKLYSSPQALSKDIEAYYSILRRVDYSAWGDVHIDVFDANTALFMARFRYAFTSTNNEKHAMEGVWTGLFVRRDGDWKIRLRHESFVPLSDESQ